MSYPMILASGSPRRRELMRMICPVFTVCPADIDETLRPGEPLDREIARLAAEKADAVFTRYPGAAVIGADTMVTLEGVALGKPRDREDAKRMLRLLSGTTHEVLTGLVLRIPLRRLEPYVSRTRVTFYPLAEEEIEQYVDTGEPMDKAGAYGIQGRGALLIQRIEGDFYSVMGLPVARLARLLHVEGIIE